MNPQAAALSGVFWDDQIGGQARGFLALVRQVPDSVIWSAVRSGSILPIVNSRLWVAAGTLARGSSTEIEERTLAFGLRSGLREVPRTKLGPQVASLAEALGAPRAVSLVKAVDSKTRRTLSALIRSASRTYALNPSLETLRRLTREIRPLIGLTPKQSSQIRLSWRALRRSGQPEAAIRAAMNSRAEGMIARRAAAIGDRGVIESVSIGRHRAWLEARDAGEIPLSAMKVWQDQGDAKVRVNHAAQTDFGPIPLDMVYPIMNVLHPPSLDFACRCWERLRIPGR